MISLPFLVFSPADRPLRWICQEDRPGLFSEGEIVDTEGLRPQMLHICSASLSLLCTQIRDTAAPLFMLRQIKLGRLRQRKERKKQKQSSEITTKGTSCTC